MTKTLITYLQLFGIGFTFGIIGPCFLVCTPILITYIAGSQKRFKHSLKDILIFLIGRLSAYLVLGLLAGLSAKALSKFTDPSLLLLFKPLAGIVSIILAISILARKECDNLLCRLAHNKIYNYASLYILGFVIGIAPCAPLLALLFDITLMSKRPLDGVYYALSFGLGTFLSALIVVGSVTGIITWFPLKILKSEKSNLVFRVACSVLLILLGLGLILR